jgi:hypothetical protein
MVSSSASDDGTEPIRRAAQQRRAAWRMYKRCWTTTARAPGGRMRQPSNARLWRGEGASVASLKHVASRDSPTRLGLGLSLAAESIALATNTTESTQADAKGNGASMPSITQAMTTRRRRKTNLEDNAIRRVLFTWRDRATRRRPERTGSRCSVRFTARDTGVRNFLIHAECCAMHCSLLAALSLAAALTTSVGVADERAARIDALRHQRRKEELQGLPRRVQGKIQEAIPVDFCASQGQGTRAAARPPMRRNSNR